MRAVIDTNILISALFWGGRPREVIDFAVSGRFQAITSAELLLELEDVLTGAFDLPEDRAALVLRDVLSYAEVVALTGNSQQAFGELPHEAAALRDPDDLKVIATALAARADHIITGDTDLLSLHPIQNILILTPAQFLEALG
ncbi:MAG TPA: putative toxin-antitoxin system toxin component, PIN family [Armatimonadota bacterium]|nr:putative toxin-antitoxin system toxin component, PIN family [Armatimonadota bacterium]